MACFVYILQSESTGKIYIGQTENLDKRLRQHNDPECKLTLYTKRNKGPWTLLHSEEYPTRRDAMRREKQLKSGQGREWIHQNLLQDNEGC